MLKKCVIAASVAGSPLFLPALAYADQGQQTPDGYIASVGIGVAVLPEFEGAKDYTVAPIPILEVENYYGFNLSPLDGISYNLYTYEDWDSGLFIALRPRAGLSSSRDEEGNDLFSSGKDQYLRGLGKVDSGLDVGGELEVGYGPIISTLVVNQEVGGGHGGLTATLDVGAMAPISERAMIGVNVSTTWADRDYMQSFFGINQSQAAASVYRKYDAGAGFKDVSIGVTGEYMLTGNVSLVASAGYSRLVGDAANSPLVQGAGGSENQFLTMFGLTYSWGPGMH